MAGGFYDILIAMKFFPKISINISVIFGGKCQTVLQSLKKVKYPDNLYEIVIIEGNHLTKQRNIGTKFSKGEIIYLLDNDSRVRSDALQLIAKDFTDKKVAAAGGPSLTPKNEKNHFSQIVGYLLATYFGAYRMRFKWSMQTKNNIISDYHFIGSNLALRKKFVNQINGFDEKFKANDETELLRRLKDKGYKLKYNHKLIVYRSQRSNISLLVKQFKHYGKGRMQHLLKNFKREDFLLLIPIVFEIYLLTIIFYHPLWYFLPLLLYILLALATSLKASIKYRKIKLLWQMTLLFPIVHLAYATGLLNELLDKFNNNRSKEVNYKIKVIKYKSMGNYSNLPGKN